MTPSIQAHLRRRATPILLLAMALDAAALNPLAMATDFLKPLGIGGVARVPCPDSVKQVLEIDATKLHAIKDQMLLQMAQGLTDSGASPMLMLPTHLRRMPSGKETGSFLALDLGGNSFVVRAVPPVTIR